MRFALFFLLCFSLISAQIASAEILSTTDKVVEKFMALDLDETETISLEEYTTMVLERLDERFKLMDADEDGEVTEEEYRTFWIKTKSQYYRPRRE